MAKLSDSQTLCSSLLGTKDVLRVAHEKFEQAILLRQKSLFSTTFGHPVLAYVDNVTNAKSIASRSPPLREPARVQQAPLAGTASSYNRRLPDRAPQR